MVTVNRARQSRRRYHTSSRMLSGKFQRTPVSISLDIDMHWVCFLHGFAPTRWACLLLRNGSTEKTATSTIHADDCAGKLVRLA
jgi:hypothetical protein